MAKAKKAKKTKKKSKVRTLKARKMVKKGGSKIARRISADPCEGGEVR